MGGGCCPGSLRRTLELVPAGPPACPFHPTFFSWSASASDLAVIEVGEQCMLFFVGSVHQVEVCKGDNADAELEINFAMTGIPPKERPTTLWHLADTAPAWRSPKCAKTGAWSISSHVSARCACLCVCFVYWQIGQNSREIRTNFARISRE